MKILDLKRMKNWNRDCDHFQNVVLFMSNCHQMMSYERTVRVITIVMEVSVQTLFRQCHLFLLQKNHQNHHHQLSNKCDSRSGMAILAVPPSSLQLLYHDIGRMFVEAWKDYVLQRRYGMRDPQTIALNVCRHYHNNTLPDGGSSDLSTDLVSYCRRRLGIDTIFSEDVRLDFYSFESDEIKKGTTLSRLT